MIDAQGHIRLIDFGFAKKIGHEGRTHTMCGTPAYLAPEVLNKTGHSFGVDIWAFGVILCEFIGGFTPFQDEEESEMFRKIISAEITWPRNIDKIQKDLISKILVPDPQMRISLSGIKTHPFFTDVIWHDVRAKKLDPPFVPGEDYSKYFPLSKAVEEKNPFDQKDDLEKTRLGHFFPFANSSKLKDF